MNLSPILKRFVDKAPLPVMMRAVLERELDAVQLDRWFETVAQQQYTRKLLFSSLFELMTQVVLRQSGSIRAAWLQTEGDVGVSLASVYNKLNGLEVGTSAALVDFAAQRSREMIDAMDGGSLELLAGVPVRVLDGNCLDGRQHRLQVTRQSTAATALRGQHTELSACGAVCAGLCAGGLERARGGQGGDACGAR